MSVPRATRGLPAPVSCSSQKRRHSGIAADRRFAAGCQRRSGAGVLPGELTLTGRCCPGHSVAGTRWMPSGTVVGANHGMKRMRNVHLSRVVLCWATHTISCLRKIQQSDGDGRIAPLSWHRTDGHAIAAWSPLRAMLWVNRGRSHNGWIGSVFPPADDWTSHPDRLRYKRIGTALPLITSRS